MVDNDADIFAISDEEELVRQVEEIISEEQITKVIDLFSCVINNAVF